MIAVEEFVSDLPGSNEDVSLNIKAALANGGILSHRVVLFKDLTDDDLEILFSYSVKNHEWLNKIRPDFITRCHPEILTLNS